MYHSPADVLLQHLVDEGIAATSGEWQGFSNWNPDEADVNDNALSVNDTFGIPDGRIQGTGLHVEHPGIQVFIRCQTHAEGHRKAVEVANALDAILRTEVSLDSHDYVIQAAAKRPTLYMGRETDARQRYRFAVNATLTIEETI